MFHRSSFNMRCSATKSHDGATSSKASGCSAMLSRHKTTLSTFVLSKVALCMTFQKIMSSHNLDLCSHHLLDGALLVGHTRHGSHGPHRINERICRLGSENLMRRGTCALRHDGLTNGEKLLSSLQSCQQGLGNARLNGSSRQNR